MNGPSIKKPLQSAQLLHVVPPFCFQLRPTSIEKEVFPFMANDGQLFAMDLQGMKLSCKTDTQHTVCGGQSSGLLCFNHWSVACTIVAEIGSNK